MENKMTLFTLSADMQAIEDALIENGGELTPELEDALTFTQDALTKKVDDYGAIILKFQSLADACKAEIDRVNAIKKTAENSVKSIKERLVWTMGQFGIEKLEGATHKFSLTKTTATETDDEQLLAPYAQQVAALQDRLPRWITLKATVSKTALKEDYKNAEVRPAGVSFVENNSLRIR